MRLFRLVFWFAVFVVAALLSAVGFMFTMTTPAHASDWNEATCEVVVKDATTLWAVKRTGMTWEEAEPHIVDAIQRALKDPEKYLKDDVDAQRSFDVAHFVWQHDLEVEVLQAIVREMCLDHWAGVGV